jgi:hypothetical protein
VSSPVLSPLRRNNHISNVQVGVNPASNTGKDDLLDAEVIEQYLGGHSSVDHRYAR